jgi:hypothetical protein
VVRLRLMRARDANQWPDVLSPARMPTPADVRTN